MIVKDLYIITYYLVSIYTKVFDLIEFLIIINITNTH